MNSLLGASCITSSRRSLVTRSVVHAERWLSSQIIVAISWLSNETIATDDDVRLKRITGTVRCVGCSASEDTGCLVATMC